jgi:uncharacterized protein YjbJ (UPF0337 family)
MGWHLRRRTIDPPMPRISSPKNLFVSENLTTPVPHAGNPIFPSDKGLTLFSSFWAITPPLNHWYIFPRSRKSSFCLSDERSLCRRTLETKGACKMNWDRVEGQWKQRRGKAAHHWGKLMNDELAAISGKYEQLVGKLQENFGIAKDEARVQVDEFKKNIDKLKKSNANLIKLSKSSKGKKKTSKRKLVTAKTSPRKRYAS